MGLDEIGELGNAFNYMAESITEKLDIQGGSSDLSKVLIGHSEVQEFDEELLAKLLEITKSQMCVFYTLNSEKLQFEHFASIGANEELLRPFSATHPEGELGLAISSKKLQYIQDIPDQTVFKFITTAGEAKPKEIITIPLLVDNQVIAVISLVNLHKYSKTDIETIEFSWMNINTSYANVLANQKTKRQAAGNSIRIYTSSLIHVYGNKREI